MKLIEGKGRLCAVYAREMGVVVRGGNVLGIAPFGGAASTWAIRRRYPSVSSSDRNVCRPRMLTQRT